MSEPVYLKFTNDDENEGVINLTLMVIRGGEEIHLDKLEDEPPTILGIYAITVLTLISSNETVKSIVNEKIEEVISNLSNKGENDERD